MPFITFFLSPVGRWVAGALVVLALLGGIYLKGRSDGYSSCKTKWEAAEQAALKRGSDARISAERDVASGVRLNEFDRKPDNLPAVAGDQACAETRHR